ncbi:MAG: VOC family protein [Bacteroidota bacterium]
MIQHIGLTINDVTEIHNFYKTVLGCEKIKQFTMDASIAGKIFGFDESPEVYFMQRQEIQVELFLSHQRIKPAWNHICISLPDAENICQAAKEAGFRTITHEGRNGSTRFVWDKMGNLFEIKANNH